MIRGRAQGSGATVVVFVRVVVVVIVVVVALESVVGFQEAFSVDLHVHQLRSSGLNVFFLQLG